MAHVPKSIVLPRRRTGKPHHRHGAFGETAADRRELKAREAAEFERRARLAKRDLDYRDSAYAAKVSIEQRGNVVTEWRGQRCIGAFAADHIRNS